MLVEVPPGEHLPEVSVQLTVQSSLPVTSCYTPPASSAVKSTAVHCNVVYNAVQYSTVPCSTVQYSAHTVHSAQCVRRQVSGVMGQASGVRCLVSGGVRCLPSQASCQASCQQSILPSITFSINMNFVRLLQTKASYFHHDWSSPGPKPGHPNIFSSSVS